MIEGSGARNLRKTVRGTGAGQVSPPPLLFARPADRHAYWAHANRQFRRPAKTIGETLTALYAEGLEWRLRTAARIAEVLTRAFPAAAAAGIGMVSLRRGTLVLCVTSASEAFQMQRTSADRLAEILQTAAPDLGVRRVRFKVG